MQALFDFSPLTYELTFEVMAAIWLLASFQSGARIRAARRDRDVMSEHAKEGVLANAELAATNTELAAELAEKGAAIEKLEKQVTTSIVTSLRLVLSAMVDKARMERRALAAERRAEDAEKTLMELAADSDDHQDNADAEIRHGLDGPIFDPNGRLKPGIEALFNRVERSEQSQAALKSAVMGDKTSLAKELGMEPDSFEVRVFTPNGVLSAEAGAALLRAESATFEEE